MEQNNKSDKIDIKDPVEEILKRYDRQTNYIIGIFVVTTAVLILMAATLIIDCFHFNSAIYKQYSSELKVHNELLNKVDK